MTLLATLLLASLAGLIVTVVLRRRMARLRVLARPSGPGASIHMADALRRSNQLAEAREVLVSAVRRHPRESALHYRLACLQSLLGQTGEARESLRAACALDRNWIAPARHDPDLLRIWEGITPAALVGGGRPGSMLGRGQAA